MELYTLNINVNKQRLSFGENKPEIFSGDQSIDFVEFTFEDDMWNFPNIWAIFSRFKGTSYQVALEDNKVMIPAEVMQKKGYVYIGLMATDGENVQTSSVLQYSIGQGATNVDAITPSASIYEQFLADLDAYQTAVADLDDIESRITTAEDNVSTIEQAVTDLNEQLGDINVDISTINGQITTIQNNIGTAQSDIVSIQNGINALNGQVAGLDTAVGTLSNRVTALQSSVTSLEGRLTTVGNTLTDFEGRLTTAGTTLTNLEGSISDAENDIQTVQGDIETIQSDIEDIQTAIEQNNVVTDVTAEGISLVDNHIADLSFMCVTDTASGDVASFPDGSGVAMKKAEVSLEPIQDLHGYDKPWPAGGGVNIWDEEWEVGSIGAGGVNASDNTKIRSKNYIPVLPNTTYYIKSPAMAYIWSYDADKNCLVSNPTGKTNATYTTASNEHFIRFRMDGSYGTTYNNDISINYPTTVTTYSPYSNICPIDGYEDVGVSVRGVNMWDEEWEMGYFDTNGNVVASTTVFHSKNYIPVVPNTTYYFKAPNGTNHRVCYYDENKAFVERSELLYPNVTFTTPNYCAYIKFHNDGTTYNNDISINYPSTDHDYHAYAGTDYEIELPDTVYGGTVDLATGELVVDRAIVDLGTLTWNTPNASGRCSASLGAKPITSSTDLSNLFCSGYETITARQWYDTSKEGVTICGAGYGGDGNCGICDSRLIGKTSAEVASILSGVQLCYELATPQTYQLTPQQIQTLVGTNNVWSEDGAIKVEYIANLKDYIDKKINA